MFPNCVQQLAHIHEARTIHVQCFYCGSPGRCQTDDPRIVATPTEVLLPLLLSWIEKWSYITIGRVWRSGFVVLPSVTARAR
jgi:hypothetical protein